MVTRQTLIERMSSLKLGTDEMLQEAIRLDDATKIPQDVWFQTPDGEPVIRSPKENDGKYFVHFSYLFHSGSDYFNTCDLCVIKEE